MTPTETLAHLRALTDPTPKQLREASNLALLATGWIKALDAYGEYSHFVRPDGTGTNNIPHPCASIDDAVRWMVPEGWCWRYESALGYGEVFDISTSPITTFGSAADPTLETYDAALALTIAGLSATLEGEK